MIERQRCDRCLKQVLIHVPRRGCTEKRMHGKKADRLGPQRSSLRRPLPLTQPTRITKPLPAPTPAPLRRLLRTTRNAPGHPLRRGGKLGRSGPDPLLTDAASIPPTLTRLGNTPLRLAAGTTTVSSRRADTMAELLGGGAFVWQWSRACYESSLGVVIRQVPRLCSMVKRTAPSSTRSASLSAPRTGSPP